MDNIFTLGHIVQREGRKEAKVYALFVDLKAAFDNVERGILWNMLVRKSVNERLRIRKTYEETEVVHKNKGWIVG